MTTDSPTRVAIVGGGVAGMATALRLLDEADARRLDLRLSLFEKPGAAGGNLRTLREHGFQYEWGPNGFLDNEPATLRLIERLDLADRVQRSEDASRRRFILVRGRLCELPGTPPAFLRSPMLSVGAKLRVLGELLIPPRRDLGRAAADPSTDETVYDFCLRRLGRDFAETLIDPMVKGVFGGDARELSLAAAFPRMVEMERDHGGLFKALFKLSRQRKRGASPNPQGVLHSFRGGMAELVDRLAAVLRDDARVDWIDGAVSRIAPGEEEWQVEGDFGEHDGFDAVAACAPAHVAASQLAGVGLGEELAAIPYVPMAVITLAFPREAVAHDLDGFGLLIPTFEHHRLLGVLWSSSIFTGRAPDGHVLMRCMAGGAAIPDILEADDDSLVDTALSGIGVLLGVSGAPRHAWVIRHERAIAQYVPGHLARLHRIEEIARSHPGLYLTGSAYRGISVNACVKDAEAVAARMADDLMKGTTR